MKMYQGVLEKVKKVEYNRGISYAKVGGDGYRFLKVLFILSFVYVAVIKFLYFAGVVLVPENEIEYMIPAICTTAILAGFVTMLCKLHAIGGSLCIAAPAVLCVYFSSVLREDYTDKLMFSKYFWRHLFPLAIFALCALGLTIIAVNQYLTVRKLYIKVTEDLYEVYKENTTEDMANDEAAWDEFLKNYNPSMDKELAPKKGEKKKKKSEE